jgi:hypothetical protein
MSNKQSKALAPIPAGMRVGNRLDIPAYTQKGVYVDTTHDPSGKAISYGRTGHLKDVEFTSKPNQAVRVGLGTKEQALTPMGAEIGSAKSPFALIKGTNVGTSDDEVRRMMIELLNDPNYTQIGMDPRRHSQFYDKSTGLPVFRAEEKLQSGPLILAPRKDLEITDWNDPRLELTDFPGKKYAPGGKVGALTSLAKKLENYVDPATKKIGDWNWKPLPDVAQKLKVTDVPDYIQGGYGEFMKEQAAKAANNQLSPRDLLKAYTITQSSIGRGGLPYNTATKAGLKLPNTGELVRPEGAFAEWLGSKEGQRYLDMAQKGEIDPAILKNLSEKFAPFGKQNQLAGSMEYAANTIPGFSKNLNNAVTGSKEDYRDWAEQLKGIAGAKSGFIGSMLGRGDLPTFDARQISLHTGNEAPVSIGSIMNRGGGQGAREAVDRLAARQSALNLGIDPSLLKHYQHLTHHAVWDDIANSKTTHDDLVKAMKNYKKGGLV